jgi:glycosyltransferase involved in cell wall biosynthesis
VNDPTVSVIIPTHNRSRMLREAVQSVLDQTFRDFEVIVVDDGSTDNTGAVVREFTDPRVRYIWRENGKLARARNTGLEAARGRFIALLDDDDTYLPHKLQVQAEILSRDTTIGLVAGGWQLVDDGNQVIKDCPPDQAQGLDLETWLTSCPLIVNSVLFRREFGTAVGGFDPSALPLEDWDFWLRLAHAGCRMTWHEGIVCRYRQHGQNTPREAVLSLYRADLTPARKYFSNVPSGDIPARIRSRQDWFIARSHLIAAFYSIDADDESEARRHMAAAALHYPKWAGAESDQFAQLIADYVRSQPGIVCVEDRIELVLQLLPTSLQSAAVGPKVSLWFEKGRLYDAYRHGRFDELPSALLFLAHADPRWFAKRGSPAIVCRSLYQLLKRICVAPLRRALART